MDRQAEDDARQAEQETRQSDDEANGNDTSRRKYWLVNFWVWLLDTCPLETVSCIHL